ncbi:MAG: hypothetical protein HGA96_11595 [Desulfobulbaceae bacterium]|nr:hypothetical protein [Desulfobulbaceae bacterium]
MLPRLGGKYEVEIEVNSRPKAEYLTDAYFALDLPVAPAIMVGEEIVTEGKDIDDQTVEVAICRQLGLPEPIPEADVPGGILGRLFGK